MSGNTSMLLIILMMVCPQIAGQIGPKASSTNTTESSGVEIRLLTSSRFSKLPRVQV